MQGYILTEFMPCSTKGLNGFDDWIHIVKRENKVVFFQSFPEQQKHQTKM
jgi:hypothetical protein